MGDIHLNAKYNRLTIINFDHLDNYGVKHYFCHCDCGNEKIISLGHIKSGHTKSCGCLQREFAKKNGEVIKHGMNKTRIHRIYTSMKTRCLNKNSTQCKHYYQRGIKICPEWLGRDGFVNFNKWAIQNGYSDSLTIDRIDVDGGYSPTNCKWSNSLEQGRNKTNTHKLEYNGKIQTLKEWSDELNIPYITLYWRIKNTNWSSEKIITYRRILQWN